MNGYESELLSFGARCLSSNLFPKRNFEKLDSLAPLGIHEGRVGHEDGQVAEKRVDTTPIQWHDMNERS